MSKYNRLKSMCCFSSSVRGAALVIDYRDAEAIKGSKVSVIGRDSFGFVMENKWVKSRSECVSISLNIIEKLRSNSVRG
jgi:hypothetical protein